jgi:ATP-binding protein involved in chromosome partitioning
MINNESILEALKKVIEPDLKKDIVSLNLVSEIQFTESEISFLVKINNPAMHSRKRMEEACAFAIERAFGKGIKTTVRIEGLNKDRTPDQRTTLPGVQHVIAVASGKGGVGKSTISVNLAVGLAKKGFKVGFIDADIYGPSAPIMFDLLQDKPSSITVDGRNYIQPIESYGVKVLSIGFFADANQAVVWRGPMASKALNQMINDVYWGDLDYMIIDLPPGTGDIHLSLVQFAPLTGAVIVSTPQAVALADARKGVGMFKLDTINVPVLGMIENMAYFTPDELPDNKYYLFGKEGTKRLAEELGVPILGEIPIIESIREAGDVGRPAVLQENTIASKALMSMVNQVVEASHQKETTVRSSLSLN